jgi:hypothetical protein
MKEPCVCVTLQYHIGARLLDYCWFLPSLQQQCSRPQTTAQPTPELAGITSSWLVETAIPLRVRSGTVTYLAITQCGNAVVTDFKGVGGTPTVGA